MKGEVRDLIKKIGIYNLIIGGITSVILSFFFDAKSVLFFLGIELGFINFIINSCTTRKMINGRKRSGVITMILFLTIRISLICVPAIILFIKNEVSFFIFTSGYISQILSIICYGVYLKRGEVWFYGRSSNFIFF